MPQRRHSETYVRSATGRKRARSRSSRRGQAPPNKGARCVTRQRVYSHVLRRNVMRCRTFEGGRVGIRKGPRRLPNGLRCVRRKKVYSPFLRKKVLRCARFSQPTREIVQAAFVPVSAPVFPAWVSPPAPTSVFTPPTVEAEVEQQPMLLLPANAASLRNRNRMYRKLSRQMRQMQASKPQIAKRWPGDRPKKRGR